MVKKCPRCGETKGLHAFHRRPGRLAASLCRACQRRRDKKRWPGMPERGYGLLPETVKAYVAGLLDGEGSIALHYRTEKRQNRYLQVIIYNTNARLMEWLKEQLGGHSFSKVQSNPRHKTAMKWVLSTRPAVELLGAVLPYLVIKRPHAELALNFFQVLETYRNEFGARALGELPAELTNMVEAVYALNRKGPIDTLEGTIQDV